MTRFRVWPALVGVSGALLILVGGPAALAQLGLRWPGWILPAIVAAAGVLVSVVISPLVTARVSVLAGRIAWFEDRRRRQTEILQRSVGSGQDLPLVREITSRRALGIHPAIPLPTDARGDLSPDLPTYVPRDCDADLRTALTRMAQTGGFILLVGPPAAGKTRSAATAVQQSLGDWRIYVRSGELDLEALLDAEVNLSRTVIWLDDIHELLDDYGWSEESDDANRLSARSVATASIPGRLTSGVIRRLLLPAVGPVIIIATTWPERRDRMTTTKASKGIADPHADSRKIIDMADQIDLSLEFSEQEWLRAKQLSDFDPRLAEAVKFEENRAVAATLANAPELIRRWRHGSDEYGRAVLSAAVDVRRCGHPEPIPENLLAVLADTYLTGGQRAAAVANEWFANALAWACHPVRGDIAPLAAESTHVGRIDGYRVSDILLDHATTSSEVGPVPMTTWHTVIKHADTAACAGICVAARRSGLMELAQYAGRRGADADDPRSLYFLATLMADSGHPEEAEALYRRSIVVGGQEAMNSAMNNLANLLAQKGGTAEAEILYRKAIDAGSPAAIYNLAVLLARSGRMQEAEALYRRSAMDRHMSAVNNLAIILADQGDQREAEAMYRAAIDGGNVDAMNNLAVLLKNDGQIEEAEQLFRRAINAGHADALNNLANLLADKGEFAQAEAFYRRAIAAGDIDALYNLALLLAEIGRLDEGDVLYRRAIDSGHAEATRNLDAYTSNRQLAEPVASTETTQYTSNT